jgi:hypothetical protein
MILRLCGVVSVLLLVSACTTGGNRVLTENSWGNYTANVHPGGGSGK